MAAKILVDARPGAREEGIREAARSPRLMGEFLSAWLPVRPSDAYCISELQLDRGFTPEAARAFLKIFDDNVRYANLTDEDVEVDEDAQATEAPEENDAVPLAPDAKRVYESLRNVLAHQSPTFRRPERRMSVTLDGETLSVAATLSTVTDVDRLIAILNANKALLPKKVTEADASEDED